MNDRNDPTDTAQTLEAIRAEREAQTENERLEAQINELAKCVLKHGGPEEGEGAVDSAIRLICKDEPGPGKECRCNGGGWPEKMLGWHPCERGGGEGAGCLCSEHRFLRNAIAAQQLAKDKT